MVIFGYDGKQSSENDFLNDILVILRNTITFIGFA